jgi:hypothetical protein
VSQEPTAKKDADFLTFVSSFTNYPEPLRRIAERILSREQAAQELLEALKFTEWTPGMRDGTLNRTWRCHCCGREKWEGHNAACRVGLAIARYKGPEAKP